MALLIIWGTVSFASTSLRTALPLYALALLLGVLWALKLLFAEAVSWKKSLMHVPVGAFAVYALVRYCASPLEYQSRIELFQIAICTLLYFVAASNFYHRRDRTILLITLLLLGMAESIFAVGQFLTRPETIFGFARPKMYFVRGSGTFFNPNHLAGFLNMVLGVLIARLALDNAPRGTVQKMVVQKVFLAFGIFVIMLGVVVTLSRGGWLSAVAGLMVLLLWGEWNWARVWPRFLVAGVGVALLIVLAIKTEIVHNRLTRTVEAAKSAENKADAIDHSTLAPRLKIWESTITMIREHPLWGTGGGTWEWFYPKYGARRIGGNPEYPHNDLLNLLSDYGLIGFALLTIALTCFYGHAYGLTRGELTSEERSFVVGATVAVTALLAHSILDFNLHIFSNAAVFMLLVGFVVAMQESPETEERVPMGPGFRYGLALGLLLFCGLGAWLIGRSALAYQYKSQADHYRTKLYWPEAQATYHKAMRLEPKDPWLYCGMGDVALNQAHWRVNPSLREERLALAREAIGWYEKALKLNPYFVEVLIKTARAYEILEDKEQVVAVCERAAKLDPQGPAAPLFLARFYLNNNDLPKAEKAALKASELNWGYWDPAVWNILEEVRARQKAPQ